MPFLLEKPDRPELETRREKREMLREMIRRELQRTNEVDPGHNRVNMQLLEGAWRRYDRRELGLPAEDLQILHNIDENHFAPIDFGEDLDMELDDNEEEEGNEQAGA